jgi:hypothetical protein
MNVLLPAHYLPNIHYFSRVVAAELAVIDDVDAFERQSYRNRCYIAGANGRQALIIPIKNRGTGLLTHDVQIDNSNNWQRIHWQSIRSAYGRTAFFEHYADKLAPFFTRRFDSLFQFDFELIKLLIELLRIEPGKVILASEFSGAKPTVSAREMIHPKKEFSLDPSFQPSRYMQAFEGRHGFMTNLSIIDALFNLGPGTVEYLTTTRRPL